MKQNKQIKQKSGSDVKKSNNHTTQKKWSILALSTITAAAINMPTFIIWGMNIPIKIMNIVCGTVLVFIGAYLRTAYDEEENIFFFISLIEAAILIFFDIDKIPSWEDINLFTGVWEEII